MSRIQQWSDWMGERWQRLRRAWSLSQHDPIAVEKALRPPYNQLLRKQDVERIGRHKKPNDYAYEPGGPGLRKPYGASYEELRIFARKNVWVRACLMIRQREIAGADWQCVPDLADHKDELDTLRQLIVAANQFEERRDALQRYRPQHVPRKVAQELFAATVGKDDITPGEIKYRCKLAYLDIYNDALKRCAPVRKLMDRPNGTLRTFDDLLRPMVEDLLAIGLGAWEKRRAEEPQTEDGRPKPDNKLLELHWLDPATLRPVLNKYGDYKGDVDPNEYNWVQFIDGQYIDPGFRASDILTVMEFPQSDVVWRGYPYSRLETLLKTLVLDAKGDIATGKKFERENYGKILHAKGIPGMNTQEDLDAMREYYEEEWEGTYALPMVVSGKEGDFKTLDISMNPGQGDKHSVEIQKQYMLRTCAAMDVPPFKLGSTEDVNRATALASGDMADEGLDNLLRLFETTLTRGIAHDMGAYDCKITATRANEDRGEELDRIEKELTLGLINLNDARMEEGYAPEEGGDQPYLYWKTYQEELARSEAMAAGAPDEGAEEPEGGEPAPDNTEEPTNEGEEPEGIEDANQRTEQQQESGLEREEEQAGSSVGE